MNGRVLQYVASLCASILIGCTFMSLIWTTSVISKLNSDDSPLGEPITAVQLSLVSFLLMAGSIIGNIFLGIMIDRFGRKGSLLLFAIPCIISWLIILFIFNIYAVLVARFIMGISLTAPIAISLLYMAEISEPDIRGRLTLYGYLTAEIANIISLTLGSISYQLVALVGAVLPAIFFAVFYFMPESPYYYLLKGRQEEAEKALFKLRNTDDVSEELNAMIKIVEVSKSSLEGCKSIFVNAKYRKTFFIVLALKSMQDLSGNIAIQNYMGVLFESADTGLDTYMSTLICIIVPIPFILISSYLVERFGRKPLFCISALGTAIAMLLEAVFFYLYQSDDGKATPSLAWMPVTGIFLSVIFKACGIGPIPLLLMAELFPNNIKGIATTITMVYGSILGSFVVLIFPLFSDAFGLASSFLVFSIFCLLGFVFGCLFIPETKGLSLNNID